MHGATIRIKFTNVLFYRNWKTMTTLSQITHVKSESIIAYQLYDDKADIMFRNVAYKIQTAGNH